MYYGRVCISFAFVNNRGRRPAKKYILSAYWVTNGAFKWNTFFSFEIQWGFPVTEPSEWCDLGEVQTWVCLTSQLTLPLDSRMLEFLMAVQPGVHCGAYVSSCLLSFNLLRLSSIMIHCLLLSRVSYNLFIVNLWKIEQLPIFVTVLPFRL